MDEKKKEKKPKGARVAEGGPTGEERRAHEQKKSLMVTYTGYAWEGP